MGRVALALEELMAGGVTGAFWLVPVKRLPEGGARALAALLEIELRMVGGRPRIARGLLWTTDPEDTRELLTALAVGPDAVDAVSAMVRGNPTAT